MSEGHRRYVQGVLGRSDYYHAVTPEDRDAGGKALCGVSPKPPARWHAPGELRRRFERWVRTPGEITCNRCRRRLAKNAELEP